MAPQRTWFDRKGSCATGDVEKVNSAGVIIHRFAFALNPHMYVYIYMYYILYVYIYIIYICI